MTFVGIDLEQFVTDPYGSGIQRVLHQLAMNWPQEEVAADFVVPHAGGFLLLTPEQAAELIGEAFKRNSQGERAHRVRQRVGELALDAPLVAFGDLVAAHSSWLLPEVSYLPSVLNRFRIVQSVMPAAMIGFDALPMTDPINYRFKPGHSWFVSEYFRLLASCQSVVCISDYAREALWTRLRRPRHLVTRVASPGGDHVPPRIVTPSEVPRMKGQPIRLLRVGTLEERKRPLEILDAFRQARLRGLSAELVFVGAPSPSNERINDAVSMATEGDIGVTWVTEASDREVHDLIVRADAFLSLGTEGFGIPVLESLALGTPVIFGGTQPAGSLMEGRGAMRLVDDSADALLALLLREDFEDLLIGLRRSVSADEMPGWKDFTETVATTVRMSS